MITKEQAALVLKAVNPAVYDGDELTRDLASTIIALWDRVDRLEKVGSDALKWTRTYRWAAPWADDMNAILKETTHD